MPVRIRHVPWAIAMVCIVLGFMLSMQFKVQEQKQVVEAAGFQRSQELADQLSTAEKDRDDLQSELKDLRSRMVEMASSQDQTKDIAAQLEMAQVQAGLIALSGPGLTITMNDSSRPITPGENPNNYIIHDEDVLKVINELAAGGAEAISINGQRLVGRSEVRCTGPTITINGVRTAPPIVITVVGNPEALDNAITMKDGIADNLKRWVQVGVKRETAVTVPAYKGSLKLQFGAPVKQEGLKL